MESFPQEGLVPKCSRSQIHCESESVQIRRNPSQRDEAAIPRIVRRFDPYDPTRAKVRYRRHSGATQHFQIQGFTFVSHRGIAARIKPV